MKLTRRQFLVSVPATTALVAINPRFALSAGENRRLIALHAKETLSKYWAVDRKREVVDELSSRFVAALNAVDDYRVDDDVLIVRQIRQIIYKGPENLNVDIYTCAPETFRAALFRDIIKNHGVYFNTKKIAGWNQFYIDNGAYIASAVNRGTAKTDEQILNYLNEYRGAMGVI